MKKKILFTIQWYPSVLSANALCDQKIIEELKKNNVEITCLTYRGREQSKTDVLDGVHVFRFRRSFWWNKKMQAKQKDTSWSRYILSLDRIILRIKQILTVPFFPFVNIKSIIKFICRAIQLHKKEHFDMVVAEHHGMDSLLAGYALKWYDPGIKFIGILWDPISAKEPARYLPKCYSEKRSKQLELSILKKADILIGMKSSERTVRSILGLNPTKHLFYDIPSIIKPKYPELARTDIIKVDKINVIFSGILSLPDRDPEYLIRALNETSVAHRLNLVFLCTGSGKAKLNILQGVFKGCITNMNYIPHDQMLAVYSQADVLLNFGGRNPNMVPSKIFEYMSFGKPVISMYCIDNEASKAYLDRYPLSVCLDERKDIRESVEDLEDFFASKLGRTVAFEEVEKLFPLNSPKVYADLLMNM